MLAPVIPVNPSGQIPPGQFMHAHYIPGTVPGTVIQNPFWGVPPGQVVQTPYVPGTGVPGVPAVDNPFYLDPPGQWNLMDLNQLISLLPAIPVPLT